MKRLVALVAFLTALLTAGGICVAHMGAERPVLVPRKATLPDGPRGKLSLSLPEGGSRLRLLRGEETTYTSTFEIRNVGPGPLTVTRAFMLDNETAPRNPLGVSVSGEGNVRTPIAPGAARRYTVSWQADRSPVSQVFATLVIESTSANPDATELDPPAVVAVVADRRIGPARHLGSILVLVPIAFGVAAWLAARKGTARGVARGLAAVGAFGALLGSVWLLLGFDRSLTAADGNDGLQMIERITLSGPRAIEIAFGADGIGATIPLVVSAIVLACVLAHERAAPLFHLGASILLGGGIGLALAQSLFTVVACAVVLVAGAIAVAPPPAEAPRVRVAVAGVGALSVVLLAIGAATLARIAGPSYLADGSIASSTGWIPDIAQTHLADAAGRTLGLPDHRFAFLATFLGAAIFLPLPFVHGLFETLFGGKDDVRGALLAAVLPVIGAQLVLRLCVGAQVDAALWGAESLPWLGVALFVWGSLGTFSARRIGTIVARLVVARAGLSLFLLFSLTPQGIAGAWLLAVTGAVGTLTAALAGAAIERRLGGDELADLGGLFRTAPRLAALLVVGILVASPVGVVVSGSGAFAGIVGAFGRMPLATLALLVPFALTAAGIARTAAACAGPPLAELANRKELEPFGGSVPDLRREDTGWVVAAIACLVVVVLSPHALAAYVERPLRDWVPRLDPAGPTQVAATPRSAGARPTG